MIAALSDNARMAVSALAGAVGVARTTVQARMERLQEPEQNRPSCRTRPCRPGRLQL